MLHVHALKFPKFAVKFWPIRKEVVSSMYYNKQSLDEVSVRSGIIKVSVLELSASAKLESSMYMYNNNM